MTPSINGTRRPYGRTVQCPSGYRAYIPSPLPPPIAWDEELVAALSRADQAIGRLAGEGRRLPNPHLFIRPFLRREAVLSSRIEGTQTTLGELFAAQAGARVEQSSADLREVANYVVALEFGIQRLNTLPLSLRLVRELHEKLMRGVWGDTATPGEFRRSQNWIGPPGCVLNNATYIPPPPEELMACLGEWENFLHDDTLPPLIHAALAHSQFEAIHPFLDGNGRVGRLLITLLFVARGVLPAPLLYLSAYLEATREEYYAHLLAITQNGQWEEWLTYFLRGVATSGRGRYWPHPTHRRIVSALVGATRRNAVGAIGEGIGAFCRKPLLDRARNCAKASGRLYHGSARPRPAGISRHHRTGWRGETATGFICARAMLEVLEAPHNAEQVT